MGLFDRMVIATHLVAMSVQHRQLMPYLRDVAADDIAGVGQMGDRAQGHLFAAAGDHHRRSRLLDRFRFENRVLDVEIPAVESRPRLGPHLRMSRTASSICRMRVAGRGGNSQPYCLYSSSKKPAPMPSVSRPRLTDRRSPQSWR